MPIEVWEGVYSNWHDALAASTHNQDSVFDSHNWLAKVVQQLLDYRTGLTEHRVELPPRPSNLPFLCALTRPRTIIDLGGSSGWTWDYLRAALPAFDLDTYLILETRTIVEYFTHSGHHEAPVEYRTEADGLEPCDVLYSNSTLQYFPSNDELLDLLQRVTPRYVLLDDVFAGDIPEYFSVQNYYDRKIPCRFLNFDTLVRSMADCGYRLGMQAPFDTPTLGISQPKPMEGFPPTHRLRHSLSALFISVDEGTEPQELIGQR